MNSVARILVLGLLVAVCCATSLTQIDPSQPYPTTQPSTSSLDFEVIQSKETIPHNEASSVRLYIKLKPNLEKAPMPFVNCIPLYTPPEYSLWDWLFNNNLLLGTWDFFTYLGFTSQDESQSFPSPPVLPPMPSIKNVQIKIELLQPFSGLSRLPYVGGLGPYYSARDRMERDSATGLSTYYLSIASISATGHVAVEINIPRSSISMDLARISVTHDGATNDNARREIIKIKRDLPTMETKLPLSVQYFQNATTASRRSEQEVRVEMSLQRIPCVVCSQLPFTQDSFIKGMELVFEKYTSHSIISTSFPLIPVGNRISFSLTPWEMNKIKKISFRVKMPGVMDPITQIIVRQPRIKYIYQSGSYQYPMEVELLEQKVFRQ